MRAYPGLMPWHLDRLWPAEIDVLIDDLNRRAAAEQSARRRANRR